MNSNSIDWLIRTLRAAPATSFNMSTWLDIDGDQYNEELEGNPDWHDLGAAIATVESCGMVGCIAGWACVIIDEPNAIHMEIPAFAAQWLGLPAGLANDLFMGNWTNIETDHIPKELVLRELEHLRLHGELVYLHDPTYDQWFESESDNYKTYECDVDAVTVDPTHEWYHHIGPRCGERILDAQIKLGLTLHPNDRR